MKALVERWPRGRGWLLGFGLVAGAGILLLCLPTTYLEGSDFVSMQRFYRDYLRRAVAERFVPWWNPYTSLGRPFFADVETACLYPPNWLAIPLGTIAGTVAFVELHLALALAGGLRLARVIGIERWAAWVCSATFALCGPLVARLEVGQIQVFAALCWMPLVFAFSAELQDGPSARRVAALALVLAGWFLAGSPPFFWAGGVGLGAWLLGRGAWPARALSGLGCVGLAGLLAASLVAVQLLPWLELIQQGNRPLASEAFAGRYGLSPGAWASLVRPPSDRVLVGPEINLYIGVPLAVLGVLGLARVFRNRESRALGLLAAVGLLLAAGAKTPVLPLLAAHAPGFGAMRFPARYGTLASLALIFLAGLELRRLRLGRPAAAAVTGAQAVAIVIGIVACAGRSPLPRPWDSEVRADLASHGAFAGHSAPPRIAFSSRFVAPDSGLAEGYSTLGGFANPQLATVWRAVHAGAGVAEPDYNLHGFSPAVFAKGPFPVPFANLVMGWDPAKNQTVWRPPDQADPRAWLSAAGRPDDRRGVRIIGFEPNQVALEARAEAPAALVLAEPWYPGWTATVNGRPASVDLALGWMRSVPVPAGPSTIVLAFRPRPLWTGLGVSAAAALVLAGCFLVRSPGRLLARDGTVRVP